MDFTAFQRNRLRGCRTWKKAAQRFVRYKADRKRKQQSITDEDAYTHSRNEALKHAPQPNINNDDGQNNTPSTLSVSPLVGDEVLAELQAENARLKHELAAFYIASPPSPVACPPQLCTLPEHATSRPSVPATTRLVPSCSAEVGNLRQLYDNLIINRLLYFPGTDENSTDKPHISSNYNVCTASFLVFDVVQVGRSSSRSEIRANGTTRRMVSRIESGIDTAVQHRKRYVWFPIRLCRSQYDSHANALLIDTQYQIEGDGWRTAVGLAASCAAYHRNAFLHQRNLYTNLKFLLSLHTLLFHFVLLLCLDTNIDFPSELVF